MSEIICVPAAIPTGERWEHFRLAGELFSARALERRDLPDGYAIRFSQADFEAVMRFISKERLCCPFLRFEMHVEPHGGSLWLHMTGPQGTREMLQAELNLAQSCRYASPFGTTQRVAKWTPFVGILCSLALCTACCLVPFALISMGIAGTWISSLQAFARYKWPLIAMTFAFLGYGFYAVYWQRRRGSGAAAAATASRSRRTVRVCLWIATVLAISGIVFEQLEPLLR